MTPQEAQRIRAAALAAIHGHLHTLAIVNKHHPPIPRGARAGASDAGGLLGYASNHPQTRAYLRGQYHAPPRRRYRPLLADPLERSDS
jgi:hypothetical protein